MGILSTTPSSVGEIPGGLFLFGEFGFGIAGLTDDRLAEFEACLQHPAVPDLYDELLSEAQSAAVFGNVRRAVLELAIAAEVFIKNAFFARESVAGAAIDYLEGAGGRSLKATELLSGAAKNAFGVSFKEVNRTDFENIDFLFRARNSIAHRGRSRFRKDSGEEIDVDWDLLKTWWSSVSNMHTWLTSQLAGRNP
jgi:small basic protein